MKALFFGVVTLFLIVGMSNDAQAACNAVGQANCRATHQDAGFTYEQWVIEGFPDASPGVLQVWENVGYR
jgi:hypothetical protein